MAIAPPHKSPILPNSPKNRRLHTTCVRDPIEKHIQIPLFTKNTQLFVNFRYRHRFDEISSANSLCFGADPLGLRDQSCIENLPGRASSMDLPPYRSPHPQRDPYASSSDPRLGGFARKRRPQRAILMGVGLIVLLY